MLADIRAVFGKAEALSTEALLQKLVDLDEAPWGDLRGKPLNARSLANYLRPHDIGSKNIRDDGTVLKGYERAAFLGGDRKPIYSTGISFRFNLFGYAILGLDWVHPFQRPVKGNHLQFTLSPGF